MFKRKTDGMPNLRGQTLDEVKSKEVFECNAAETEAEGINESAVSEPATKDDIDNFIKEHNNASDAHADILKKKSEFVTVKIPAGRMLGDVNDDGKVDMVDAALIRDHIAQIAYVTDEDAVNCLDANNDGGLNVNDISHARNVGRGILKYGKQPDLSGEWQTNSNYRDDYYQFCKDIAIAGLTEENSAIIFVPERSVYDVIAKVECKEGVLRVYVTKCPPIDAKCKVQIFEGDGTADAVYSGESVFVDDFTVNVTGEDDLYTADYYFADIKKACDDGNNISLHYNGKLYTLAHADSKSALFARIYADNPKENMCVDAFMFVGEYVFRMNTELADKGANIPKVAKITIPNGRMVGDVNGDGLVDKTDVNMISRHVISNGKYLTDETQIICADTDPNNVISSNDRNFINAYIIGSCRLGRFSRDVRKNWTVNPNYEEEDGQFYVDVDIDGMTELSSANVIISGSGDAENYYAVCLDGKLRIYAKLCPTESLSATVIFYAGDGNCTVEFTSEVHSVRFDAIKIPAGRMLGDVNEDGSVDELDAVDINDYLAGRIDITDKYARMCLDADSSGVVNSTDADRTRDVGRGAIKYGRQPDLLGNWTVNPDYEYEKGQFYVDIDVSGISESNSAVIFVPDYSVYEVIVKAECLDGKIRIYTKRCPLSEAICKIQIFRGDGRAEVVYSGANIPEEKAKTLYFTNKIINASDFRSSSECSGYPYRAKIALKGITENYTVDVIFDDYDAISGNYAPLAKTSDGYVSIYAKVAPSSSIYVPVIKCERVVSL